MALSFDKALGIHQHTLGIRSRRSEVIASNIANADTPAYKAKDIDFSKALQDARSKQGGMSMSQTNDRHFELQTELRPEIKYRVPNQPDTGDGNTIDMQKEQAVFMQNALEYQMSLGFLDSKFSGLKRALKGN